MIDGVDSAMASASSRSIGRPAAQDLEGQRARETKDDFLKLAKMSPMERMRANILKGMGMTEDQLGALPPAERQKVEEQIKESIKKMTADPTRKGRLVDVAV